MNTQELQASEAISKVNEAPADAEIRVLRRWFPGDPPIQQGDVYLHPVPLDWARGKLRSSSQIADGTSVGSRHIVHGADLYEGTKLPPGCTLPEGARMEDILGPVIVGRVGESPELQHPKHAWHQFPLENCAAQVTYPFDFTTRRREQD
jgi:hypothetical protein